MPTTTTTMSNQERRKGRDFSTNDKVLVALVSALVPSAKQLDETALSEIVAVMNSVMQGKSARMKQQVQLFLRAIQWLPALRYARTFTSMTSAQRPRFLRSLENNRIHLIRIGFGGLRSLVLFAFYGRQEAKQAIGYGADTRGWEAFR